MASGNDELVCHVCGFKNKSDAERCVSCGAKLEELSAAYTEEEQARRDRQPAKFSLAWAGISFVAYVALQAIFLAVLPAVIDSYDPQGYSALMTSLGVWVGGGVLIGLLSPGKTFIEPAVGALLAVAPTVWWISSFTPDAGSHFSGPGEGFQLTLPAYVIGGLLGAMISLFGAFAGEKLQERLQSKR